MICCTRSTFDAKVATMIRCFSFSAKILSNVLPTVRSDIVKPGFIIFVLSPISARTPFFPSSPKRCKSIVSPLTGVKSTLKSPVCTTNPAGVKIARAAASEILWFVRINSTRKHPKLIDCPYLTTLCFTGFGIVCSFNLFSISPIVSLVA